MKSERKRQAILAAAYRLFREQGFEKTSIAELNARVGGSKATIYSHFASKEDLFVECMIQALENYMSGTLEHLRVGHADPGSALREFGKSVLTFVCSPEQLEVRRLMIAEAARSGAGKLFFDRLTMLRGHLAAYLSACMAAGGLRREDPHLAADHFGALLEAEILEPLLLQVRDTSPDAREITTAVEQAVAAFLRAYAPEGIAAGRPPLTRSAKESAPARHRRSPRSGTSKRAIHLISSKSSESTE